MDQLNPIQKDNCLFTDAERALLAKLHQVMAEAIKKKSKRERAEIMKVIGAEHQNLMIRWFMCRMSGQIRG